MRLVSFDVWGTLLRIEPFYEAAARAMEELGILGFREALDLLVKGYREVKGARRLGAIDPGDVIGSSVAVALGSSGAGLTKGDVFLAFARAANRVSVSDLLIPGSLETVERLHEEGYSLAVASNVIYWPGYVTRVLLDRAGFSKFFRVQVYADEVGRLKPDPGFFAELLRLTGAPREGVVHVGDSPQEDLAGALAAGVAGVLVDGGRGEAFVDESLRIAVVRRLEEVPGVIPRLLRVA